MTSTLLKTLLLLFAIAPATAHPVGAPVTAELVAENTALHPGENWIGLHLQMRSGWHVYWRNPGVSGRAPSLKWELPQGVTAADALWPVPEVLHAGDLTSYVYSDSVLLPIAIRIPDHGMPTTVSLKAEARWLACSDACIPGHASLNLSLPFVSTAAIASASHALFNTSRVHLPQPAPTDLRASALLRDGKLALDLTPVTALGHFERARWLPVSPGIVDDSAAPLVRADGDRLHLEQVLNGAHSGTPDRVDGVLILDDGGSSRAMSFTAAVAVIVPARGIEPARIRTSGGVHVWMALALAFAGGLILNLMPCVLPVLSMKALALIELGPDDRRAQQRSALAYTAGVIGSCLTLGALLLGLRAAGSAIGWGFQLQSPIVITLLAYLFFSMALSLSGLVEFGAQWMGVGESLTRRKGWQGSLFTGALAMIAASPCTAPFMGTALGYAMTQSAALALAVFAMLGLGLSSPFLLLAWFSPLARLLPRPGAWMNGFRKAMAVPLYLTVVWLVWILARQAGPDTVAMALAGFVALGVGLSLWRHGHWLARTTRLLALGVAFALAGEPAVLGASAIKPATTEHEAWSPQRLSQLRQEGRIVFVNFTADWCLTCKVNEKVALENRRVRDAFAQHGVSWLTADWTRPDPAITEELAHWGRDGVPLYILYRPGHTAEVLPQILTPEQLLERLDEQTS